MSTLTVEQLSPELLHSILESPDRSDKIWGLDHRKLIRGSSQEIREALLDFVVSPDYNLAERAVNAIDSSDLSVSNFQVELVNRILTMAYALRKPAIQKLTEAPSLDREVFLILANKLSGLSADLLIATLDLFAEHSAYDLGTCRRVSELLSHSNPYIARQAYHFLIESNVQDKSIQKKLMNFGKE